MIRSFMLPHPLPLQLPESAYVKMHRRLEIVERWEIKQFFKARRKQERARKARLSDKI